MGDFRLFDNRVVTAFIFGCILVGGTFLRLYQLGAASMGSDMLAFMTCCNNTASAAEIFEKWEQLQPYGHLPFVPASTQWLIKLLNLEVSHFSVRLAPALWGVLSIPAALGLGLC